MSPTWLLLSTLLLLTWHVDPGRADRTSACYFGQDKSYCKNGGTCEMHYEDQIVCQCRREFRGNQCTIHIGAYPENAAQQRWRENRDITRDYRDGNWVVFQHRTSGEVDFNRNWDNYTQGFGSDDNYWIGLDTIYNFCNENARCQMRIDMSRGQMSKYAMYSTFYIDGPTDMFRLHLSGYSGTAGDSMVNAGAYGARLDGMKFTTVDKDNDQARGNCAVLTAPWWHRHCTHTSLNGVFGPSGWHGLFWYTFGNIHEPLSFTEMRLSRINN